MHTPDIETAVLMYHKKPEIGTTEIMELFGVSQSKAKLMKKEVLKRMTELSVKVWMPHMVSTKTAFDMWGILIVGVISWAVCAGIIKLITMCFSLKFSLPVATGVWLIVMLIRLFMPSRK